MQRLFDFRMARFGHFEWTVSDYVYDASFGLDLDSPWFLTAFSNLIAAYWPDTLAPRKRCCLSVALDGATDMDQTMQDWLTGTE